MQKHVALTFAQFALTLGLSESTLRRRLKSHNISTTGKLLSPVEQHALRRLLGFPEVLTPDQESENPH
ncbi:MAG: hypothetical protein IT270_07265 [Saprospiraceae bacterium]|nr:hypothetical protein [Saprospiraceae bacterium]